MNLLQRLRQDFKRNSIDRLAIIFLALWPWLYNWQAALRLAVFSFGDIFLFFYPTHRVYAEALREFRLPLWTPQMLAGFPLFAEGQIGALYPTHPFLYGLLPIDLATNYDILFHLSWVAVGTFLFARSLKLHPAAALLAGMCFGWGGFFTPRYQHMSVLATASWLPWLLWAWEKREQESDRGKRARWFVLLGLMSGIQLLGGHPQFAFLSAIFLALYAVVRWKRDATIVISSEARNPVTRTTRPLVALGVTIRRTFFEFFNPRALIPVILFFAIGALIASAQLVPTFELGNFSNRATGLLPKFFNAYSLRLVHFVMLFIPFIVGNPYPQVSVEVMGYIGLPALLLALCAIFVRRDRRSLFFLLIALGSLWMGTGDQNIFYRGLRYLPLFSYFRVPSRFFYWYTFCAAMLAAFAFDYFIARAKNTLGMGGKAAALPADNAQRGWAAILGQYTRAQKITVATLAPHASAGVFATLAALIAILVPYVPLEPWLTIWVWLPLALGCAGVWVVLGARRSLLTRGTLIATVLGLALVDIAMFSAVYSKTYDSTTSIEDFYSKPDSLSVIKDVSDGGNRVLTSLWIYPVPPTMRESLFPNYGMIYGIPNAIGYTPLIYERHGQYLEKMTTRMMNLLNVRYYLIPQMLPTTPQVEGDDLENAFMLKPLKEVVAIPPTLATKLVVSSSLAQSENLKDGDPVAQIILTTQDGKTKTLILRAGIDTAEWAYDREDVRAVIKHSEPPIASTYPARSAFPTVSHPGHTFLAQYDIADQGKPITVTSVFVSPFIHPGLIHFEKLLLVAPDGKEISIAHLAGRDDQSLIFRSYYVAVYENPDSLPRAFIVHNTKILPDSEAFPSMARNDFDPRRLLILVSGAELNASDAAQRDDESVKMVEYKPERVALEVRASADGYVLLTDSWYPGWVALVDGVETPIERADYIYRAVRVSAGTHRVEFEYRPWSLYVGAALSLIALLILGGVYVWSRRVV